MDKSSDFVSISLSCQTISISGNAAVVRHTLAGATISGHSAGPVRPPLSDLKPEEFEQLRALMAPLGPQ